MSRSGGTPATERIDASSQINLNALTREVALAEGLGQGVGVAQVREIIGILGHRWRNMPAAQAQAEVHCIMQRAGLRSAHRER